MAADTNDLPDLPTLFDEWLFDHRAMLDFSQWLRDHLGSEQLAQLRRFATLPEARQRSMLSLPQRPRGWAGRLVHGTGAAWAACLMLAVCTFAYIAWDSRQDATLAKAQAKEQTELREEAEALRTRIDGGARQLINRVIEASEAEQWLPMVQRLAIAKGYVEEVSGDLREEFGSASTDAWIAMTRAYYGEEKDLDRLYQALMELETIGN